MRIGIEGQRLFRPHKYGMDIMALELIKHLQKIDHFNEYLIFVKPDTDSNCIPQAPNFKIVEIKSCIYPIWEQMLLPRVAFEQGCDVLHCTSDTAPLHCKIPVIVTLHDIIFTESCRLFSGSASLYQRLGNLYRRLIVQKVVQNSQMVITVSHYEQEHIRQRLRVNPQKLHYIYNGVSTHFKYITQRSDLVAAQKQYDLPKEFIVFIANTDPKKNTVNTILAFTIFKRKTNSVLKMVILNYSESQLRKTLQKIKCEELIKEFVLTGYVPNIAIPDILSQSTLFLYTSLRESFGIPILEAMACHVPVITSNVSAMPEIAGKAAMLINPHQAEEIANAIHTITQSKSLQMELIEKGIHRVAHFSWKKTATRYLDLYCTFSKTKL